MRHTPYTPTEADLRAAYDSLSFARAGIGFEEARRDKAYAIVLRNVAEIRARRVPAAPEPFELQP